jgi:hypothetical protein
MGDIDMKIPKGWPTEEMLFAAREACDDMFQTDFIRAFKAALAAAPKPPAPAQHFEEQPDGSIHAIDPADVAPPAQEAEPVYQMYHEGAWEDVQKSRIDWCKNHGLTTRILYTHAPSEELRQAAKELVEHFTSVQLPPECTAFVKVENLRAALKGKS